MSGTAARLWQTGSLVSLVPWQKETSVPQNLGLWADSLLSSPHSRVRLNLLDQLGPCGRRPIPVPVERKPVAGNGPFRRPYYSVETKNPSGKPANCQPAGLPRGEMIPYIQANPRNFQINRVRAAKCYKNDHNGWRVSLPQNCNEKKCDYKKKNVFMNTGVTYLMILNFFIFLISYA